ncbi:MAG: hypothetical protein II453_14455 [Alphaproteobacteria bacterium]|nr:hypothetical protein [Alphaproteobacteria bacterium]
MDEIIRFEDYLGGPFRDWSQPNHKLYFKLHECWGPYTTNLEAFNAIDTSGQPYLFNDDDKIKPAAYVGKLQIGEIKNES